MHRNCSIRLDGCFLSPWPKHRFVQISKTVQQFVERQTSIRGEITIPTIFRPLHNCAYSRQMRLVVRNPSALSVVPIPLSLALVISIPAFCPICLYLISPEQYESPMPRKTTFAI